MDPAFPTDPPIPPRSRPNLPDATSLPSRMRFVGARYSSLLHSAGEQPGSTRTAIPETHN